MTTHIDLLANMPRVRLALVSRYQWFIHTTPQGNIESIRRYGLRTNRDAAPPPEVIAAIGAHAGAILCLHPLGAKLCPGGANANLVLGIGQEAPKRVSFAIIAEDLPALLGVDWSYTWPLVSHALNENPNWSVEEAVLNVANEYGSIALYSPIVPSGLRVFCANNQPANPLSWKMLNAAQTDEIVRHT
jgi:hypothetical protein